MSWSGLKERESIVLVDWVDIVSSAGWHDDHPAPASISSVGYFLKQDDKNLWISTSIHEKEQLGVLTIPKAVIQEVSVVEIL